MIVKTTGHYIIYEEEFSAEDGVLISHPDGVVPEKFPTKASMRAEFAIRYPDKAQDRPLVTIKPTKPIKPSKVNKSSKVNKV